MRVSFTCSDQLAQVPEVLPQRVDHREADGAEEDAGHQHGQEVDSRAANGTSPPGFGVKPVFVNAIAA